MKMLMKIRLRTLICFVIFMCCSSYFQENLLFTDVINEEDFQLKILSSKNALVIFYNSSTPSAYNDLKAFIDTAKTHNKEGDVIARVDCATNGRQICEKVNINFYPTIKSFIDGHERPKNIDNLSNVSTELTKYVPFNIEFTQTGFISSYKKEKDLPKIFEALFESAQIFLNAPKKINKHKHLRKFTKANNTIIIGYFIRETLTRQAFIETAIEMANTFKFVICVDEKLLRKQPFNNSIILYRATYLRNEHESDYVRYKGRLDVARIKKFIFRESHGLVGHRTKQNQNEFPLPLITVYCEDDFVIEPNKTIRNKILTVARRYYRQIRFAMSSAKEFRDELQEYSLEKQTEAHYIRVIAKDSTNHTYTFNNVLDEFEEFVQCFQNGDFQGTYKSQPIQIMTNSTPVQVLVATNFLDIMNIDKDVLLQLHRTDCKKSTAFQMDYEKLAKVLKALNVVVVKMDVSSIDLPSNDVWGSLELPAVFWLNNKNGTIKYKKIPTRYDGEWSYEQLLQFVASYYNIDNCSVIFDQKTITKREQ